MPVLDSHVLGSSPVGVENALHLLKASASPQVCSSNSQTTCFQFPLSLGLTTLQPAPQVPRGFALQPTVVLSYPDVRLAGLRALHSFTPYRSSGTNGSSATAGKSANGQGASTLGGGGFARSGNTGGASHLSSASAAVSSLSFLPPCLTPSVRAVFGCGDATVELASAIYTWQGPAFDNPAADTDPAQAPQPFVQVVSAEDPYGVVDQGAAAPTRSVATTADPADRSAAPFHFPGISVPTSTIPSTTGSSTCLTQHAQTAPTDSSTAFAHHHEENPFATASHRSSVASPTGASADHRAIQVHVLNVTADWAETERISLVQITGLPDPQSVPWFADALVAWLTNPTRRDPVGSSATSPYNMPAVLANSQGSFANTPLAPTAAAAAAAAGASPSVMSGEGSQVLIMSPVRRVLIVAAADFKPNRGAEGQVHEFGSPFEEPIMHSASAPVSSTNLSFFSGSSNSRQMTPASLPRLDASTTVNDPFLHSLCSLLAVQGIPFTGLLYPAKRLPAYLSHSDTFAPRSTAYSTSSDAAESDAIDSTALVKEARLNSKFGEPIPVSSEDRKIVEALCYELDGLTGLPFNSQKGCQTQLRYQVRQALLSQHEQLVQDSMMYL
ncbi:hypothetical protein BJ085DRAFT_37620 [Dimargaris cristalligena]|uniref:Uncharacterized protein n=1 Tax=Dimargaris cristalligena TaxID=215637 RepID=A0A4Q0A4L0_9FUNG|nr:hypothetical protein BJ085DRAFT_37620 [Dimargaris cristalligena]|eukprot:RKP40190.1 hypothetical protein BJ085DRAFT_37620 [Dimargaris cristalligena]